MKTRITTSPRLAVLLLLMLVCNSGCAFHNRQGTMFNLTGDYNSYLRKALIWEEFDLRPMRRHRVEYFRWRHPINRMASVTLYPDEIEVEEGQPCPYVLPSIPKFQDTKPPLPPVDGTKEQPLETPLDESYNSVPSPPPFPSLDNNSQSKDSASNSLKKPTDKASGKKDEEPQFVPAPPLPREAKEINGLNSVARVVSLQRKVPSKTVNSTKTKARKKSGTGILFPRVR